MEDVVELIVSLEIVLKNVQDFCEICGVGSKDWVTSEVASADTESFGSKEISVVVDILSHVTQADICSLFLVYRSDIVCSI